MLAPASPRPSSLLKRVLDAFASPRPPAARPFREMGASGTGVFGGYVQTRERSPQWVGAQRYVTISDMAVNASIVAAGVHYFLNLIAHPRWTFHPPEKLKKDSKAQAAADLVAEIMDDPGQPWSRVVRRAGTFRFYGFGVQEWTAKRRPDGRVGLASIEPRPQATIERWSVDESGAVTGVWQRPPQTGELLGIPRSKILYLVDDVLSDSPEGVGIFRHLAEPWERLKQYYALEARAFERDLRGTPVGRIPYTMLRDAVANNELTKDEAAALVEAMERFVKLQVKQSDTAITLDSIPYYSQAADGSKVAGVQQWGLELLQGGSAGMAEVAASITRTQTEMARVLACEGLMMGEQSGNRSLGEDKSRNLYLIGNAVLSDIVGGVRQDIVSAVCDLNGIPEEKRPVPEVEDIAFKSAESVARILAQMAQAGAVLAPDDPVVEDVRSLMGVSPPPPPSPEMMGVAAGPGGPRGPRGGQGGAQGGGPPPPQPEPAGGPGEAPEAVGKAFDPSQPRDDDGKWTGEGGGGGSSGSDEEKERMRATVLRWVKGALTIGLVASLAIPVAYATGAGVAAYSIGFVGARFAAAAAVEALIAHAGISRVAAVAILSAITDGLIAARERELEKDPSLAKAADLILQRLRGAKAALAAYGQDIRKAGGGNPRTLYVSRRLLNAGAVRAWAVSQGFESTLPASDMHVTVAYSKDPVDWSAVEPDRDALVVMGASRVEKINPNHDELGRFSEGPGGGGEKFERAAEGAGWAFGSGKVPGGSMTTPFSLVGEASNPLVVLTPMRSEMFDSPKHYSLEDVPVRDLKVWQNNVEEEKLRPLGDDYPPIHVYRINSELVVGNGNHRAASAFVEGRSTIRAKVADLDARNNSKYWRKKFRKEEARTVHQFDGGAVVLTLESSELQRRWQELRDAGASWDYPDYRPHVTITYAGAPADISSVDPYSGPLIFGPEEFAEVDEEGFDPDSIEEEALLKALYKTNPNHDELGRFASGSGGGGAGGSGSSDADGPVLYHGTSSQLRSAIMQEGLRPGRASSADAWAKKHGWAVHTMMIGDRAASVYATPDRAAAERYARYAQEVHGGDPVVLEVRIPRARRDELLSVDEEDRSSFRFKGVVQPEWISVAKRDDDVVFIVVAASGFKKGSVPRRSSRRSM